MLIDYLMLLLTHTHFRQDFRKCFYTLKFLNITLTTNLHHKKGNQTNLHFFCVRLGNILYYTWISLNH